MSTLMIPLFRALRYSRNVHGMDIQKRLISYYKRRPIRDSYEYDDGGDGGWEYRNYRRTWRDWIYDRRVVLRRAGLVIVGAGGYYWYHLEAAPLTGRKRFIAMSPSQEQQLGEMGVQEIIHQYRTALLPTYHPSVRLVERVTKRIIAAIDPALLSPDTRWRVFVIDSPQANAFVLPNGDIFIFTGIIPVAENEDGLAAIIGHEIAHKIARHSAEKMSTYQFITIASSILQLFVMGEFNSPLAGLLRELFLFLPFSRTCETEADYIGLMLMSRACYDPNEAVRLWRRMQQQASSGREPPAFLSTHPSHAHRIEKIQGWLTEAQKEYEASGCSEQKSFFRTVF